MLKKDSSQGSKPGLAWVLGTRDKIRLKKSLPKRKTPHHITCQVRPELVGGRTKKLGKHMPLVMMPVSLGQNGGIDIWMGVSMRADKVVVS